MPLNLTFFVNHFDSKRFFSFLNDLAVIFWNKLEPTIPGVRGLFLLNFVSDS